LCVESTSVVFFLFLLLLQEIFIEKNCLLRTFLEVHFDFFFWRGFSASKSRWDLKSFTPKLGKFLWYFFSLFFVPFEKQFNRFSIFYQLESEGPCGKFKVNLKKIPKYFLEFCCKFNNLEQKFSLNKIILHQNFTMTVIVIFKFPHKNCMRINSLYSQNGNNPHIHTQPHASEMRFVFKLWQTTAKIMRSHFTANKKRKREFAYIKHMTMTFMTSFFIKPLPVYVFKLCMSHYSRIIHFMEKNNYH